MSDTEENVTKPEEEETSGETAEEAQPAEENVEEDPGEEAGVEPVNHEEGKPEDEEPKLERTREELEEELPNEEEKEEVKDNQPAEEEEFREKQPAEEEVKETEPTEEEVKETEPAEEEVKDIEPTDEKTNENEPAEEVEVNEKEPTEDEVKDNELAEEEVKETEPTEEVTNKIEPTEEETQEESNPVEEDENVERDQQQIESERLVEDNPGEQPDNEDELEKKTPPAEQATDDLEKEESNLEQADQIEGEEPTEEETDRNVDENKVEIEDVPEDGEEQNVPDKDIDAGENEAPAEEPIQNLRDADEEEAENEEEDNFQQVPVDEKADEELEGEHPESNHIPEPPKLPGEPHRVHAPPPPPQEEPLAETDAQNADSGLRPLSGHDVNFPVSQPDSRMAVGGASDADFSTLTGGPSTDAGPSQHQESNEETSKEPSSKDRVSSAKTAKAKSLNHCLNLSWCFGVNKSCPALNMLYKLNADDPGRDAVLYTCSNVAVLYDFNENSQTLLQGHSHAITCSATSEDKRWLVTADSGKYASIIVWDTFTFIPVQTVFDPHPALDGSGTDTGVAAIAMTNDAKYVVSISSSTPQTVCVWDWTSQSGASATASVTLNLPVSSSLQTFVKFNPANYCQIVSNSQDQVVFYLWDGAENLEYFDPKVTDKDFNRPVGTFSQSVHAPGSHWTFTATSNGNVVVWAPEKALDRQASKTASSLYKLKAFKLVRLQERAITVLTTHDQYVVTGDVVGYIKFYDNQLRMINWYQEFQKIGPVNSVSFAYCPGFPFTVARNAKMPTDATIEANKFPIKDFILSTVTAKIGKVQNDGTELIMISQEHDDAIHAVAAHPQRPHICMGSFAGYIKIWDYLQKKTVCDLRIKPRQLVTCLTYDPSGKYIAIGFEDGSVRVMDSLILADELKEPFVMSQKAITHIKFSHNSKYLVTADKDLCVVVYKAQFSPDAPPFAFFGKNRAHYKEITEIIFGIAMESDLPRLISIGKDRVLVEYDLENSAEDDIKIASTNKIEQSAVPLCLAWYPPVMKEDFLVTANDQYKLKLYNSTTKMCRKTVLGPTYGSPVTKLAVLPFLEDPFNEPRYLAFATKDRIGLHKLPVMGNPHDAMVTVAHPQGISDLCVSYDSKFVFTAGGVDATVQMWQVHFPAMEASAKLGGEDLVPFYDLIQGGREGQLFRELEDYFYYAMIRSQGVNTMKQRHVSVTIPISEIPFVMRALGFYPTEQEIDDMLNEVKFSKYVETGNYVTEIDLNTFIKLYVNHRPAFGLNPELIMDSFKHLGVADQKGQHLIDRDDFIELLQNRGEQLNDAELAEFISVLLGASPEGSVSEMKDFKAIEQDPMLLEKLPVEISADMFSTTLLGFQVSSLFAKPSDEPDDEMPRKLSNQPSAKSVRLVTTGIQSE